MSKKTETYRKTEILTSSPETILLMLYAGAIRFLKQAKEAVQKNQVKEKNEFLKRAIDIIQEFRATLNHEVGGDVSKQLDGLYAYCLRRLVEGNLEKKYESIDEVIKILETLNDGWEKAIEQLRSQKSVGTTQK